MKSSVKFNLKLSELPRSIKFIWNVTNELEEKESKTDNYYRYLDTKVLLCSILLKTFSTQQRKPINLFVTMANESAELTVSQQATGEWV